MDIEKIIESSNTKDLYMVATQFCTFIEKIQPFQPQDALEYLLKITPLLYIKGLLIPSFKEENEYSESRLVTEEEYEAVYLRIKEKFEEFNYFESFQYSLNQSKTYDMAELITDIYQDLKDFVLLYNKQTFTAQSFSIKICYDAFYERWGRNISVLLSYLHHVLHPTRELFEEI